VNKVDADCSSVHFKLMLLPLLEESYRTGLSSYLFYQIYDPIRRKPHDQSLKLTWAHGQSP
jgi:hypothetical protein